MLESLIAATLLAQAAPCVVEVENPEPRMLRVRSACWPRHAELQSALLAALASRKGEVSLSLGRIVAYPWLSTALARQASSSRVWDPEHGTARGTGDNAYVAAALRGMPEFTVLFGRWNIQSVSVEKVLRRRADELALAAGTPLPPASLLPYDAIVSVTLRLHP